MPGNRTQLTKIIHDIGFEGRGKHQLLNHSQLKQFKNQKIYQLLIGLYKTL